MAICPECEADIDVDEFDVDKGDLITCTECGTQLEVISVTPIELDVVSDDDEDEDDLDEDEDDLDEDDDEEEDWEE
jgi:alpha-aminoadipate/glutamate carrier protein LysW